MTLLRFLGVALLFTIQGQRAEASAFPLPPRIEEKTLHWIPEIKNLATRKALGLEILSREPQLNGGLSYNKGQNKLYVLSTDYQQVDVYDLAGGPHYPAPTKRALTNPTAWKTQFFRDNVLGNPSPFIRLGAQTFRADKQFVNLLTGPHPSASSIWSVDLGFVPTGLESQPGRGLTAWSAIPPKLFYLPTQLTVGYRYVWDETSEPVRFWECDVGRVALVENMSNRYSRFVFLNAKGANSYTIFDFAETAASRSEVSGVISINGCEDFIIAGVFGVVRVRYPARF